MIPPLKGSLDSQGSVPWDILTAVFVSRVTYPSHMDPDIQILVFIMKDPDPAQDLNQAYGS